jgi:EAL domain-containing protein (putative c-di-GMP-specific phosphodiesterase class I)
MAQGYLFARPQPLDQALATISALNAPPETALTLPGTSH